MSGEDTAPRPMVAPCRALTWRAPLGWLRAGWQDFRRAPRSSALYGIALVLLSLAVSYAAWRLGRAGLLLGMLTGFVLIGPLLAVGLYAVSAQLAAGVAPSLTASLRATRRVLSDLLIFAIVLLVVVLVWARAAMMIYVFFPVGAHAAWTDLALFLGIGTAVGAFFAAVVFCASAFSLPMLHDRRVDTVTAVITSINAVLRNKPAMIVWALCIGAAVVVGLATAYAGFAVTLPVMGYATWHAYVDTIDGGDWPPRGPPR